jgi:hypothetical protein
MQILLNETESQAWLQNPVPQEVVPDYIWQDGIQEDSPLWGFDGIGTNNPGYTPVAPDDANGVNLSRVPDPVGGSGYALRHYAMLDKKGAYVRSQAGVYGSRNKVFNDAATSPEGIYLAQECYLPEVLKANNDPFSWLSLLDIHTLDGTGANRSWLGLNVMQNGSMRAGLAFGGPLYNINKFVPAPFTSAHFLPVGRWFDIKIHYIVSTEPTTVRLWIDNELAIVMKDVITALPSNTVVDYYVKLYAGVQGDNPWVPTPTIRYSRNARAWKWHP